jgi:hypothetical protein
MPTSSGWALQYLARWESPELFAGPGSRSSMWGSIEVTKTFRGCRAFSASLQTSMPQVGLSNINAREMQYLQNDYGSFWARLLH